MVLLDTELMTVLEKETIMDENISLRSKRKAVSDHKAAIADMLTEMQRLNQQMQNDQTTIDRLNAETALLKEETRALLNRMGAPI